MKNETVAGTPADPTIKPVLLKLGKKEYKLAYDFDSIAIAEEITGMNLLVGVDWRNIGVRRIRAMLYASALKFQPDTTIAEFTPHIKHSNILRIQLALAEAWVESTPEQDENETPAAEAEEKNEQKVDETAPASE